MKFNHWKTLILQFFLGRACLALGLFLFCSMNISVSYTKKIEVCILIALTGMFRSRFPPPIKLPFWKLKGYTCFPNLCSRSLAHAMFFLSTFNSDFPRTNLYVSLNKLHAINPHGTIGSPLCDCNGLQELVSLYASPCNSCLSLLLLTYLKFTNKTRSSVWIVNDSMA